MIELSWDNFKSQVLDTVGWSWIYFDVDGHYKIFAKQNDFTVVCKIYKDDGSDQSDFESNYKDNVSKLIVNNTKTQFEREDIILKLSRVQADFDVSGEAKISIKVPGTPGTSDVRYVAGGYAFTDVFSFGDAMNKIQVVDVDNIIGMGANTVLKTYHDEELDEENQGWYLWPSPQAGGEVEIDPIGYYGEIPAGLYLEIYFKKTIVSGASKVFCDIWWGKNE
jgi:hypothetical protein